MSVTRATPVATTPQKPVGRGTQRADTSRDTIIEWPAKEEDIDQYREGLRASMLHLTTNLLRFETWYDKTIVPLSIRWQIKERVTQHVQNIFKTCAAIMLDSRSEGRTNITEVRDIITRELAQMDTFLLNDANITSGPLYLCKGKIGELVNEVVVLLDKLEKIVNSDQYKTLRTQHKHLYRDRDWTR
jgi:hypothetical protein